MFGNPQQNQNQGGVFGNLKSAIMQIAVMWLVINLVFKKGGMVVEEINQKTGEKQIKVQPTLPTTCLFKPQEMMNLKVYLAEGENFHDFDPKKLIWSESKLFLGDRESNSRTKEVNITASSDLQNNGTMFAYFYLYKAGFQPDPTKKPYSKDAVIEVRYELVKYFFEKKDNKINLMSGDEPEVKDLSERRILGHWKDNITLALVTDTQPLQLASITPQMAKHMLINKESNTYYPTFYVNDFWTYRDHYYPINETTTTLPLRFSFETKEMWKWTLMVQMDESFLMQREWGATNDGDSDDVKRMISETNLWLLALTGFVSILHMTFDFLAFKNDIQFWKNRKDMKGLSIRTIFINFFCQIVIFLYLLDNDTSWMILLSSGVGLLIEGWKITRTTNVKVKSSFPFLSIEDKESYNETKEYDKQAMTYLTYILFPLVLCYSIYSLVYKTHKSWYSWILSSLTGAVYTFGFILMTPQLFLNYKFKTVAHLPWRVFVYKALNTFVDDLFAFIIKMPLLHRLSCFRDDLIFLIFLYQRWIYPVDKSRTNEFGQSFEDDPNNNINTNTNTNNAVDNKVDVKDENGETKKDK